MSTTRLDAGVSARTRVAATEAAFAGLRVLRARPAVLLVWAGLVLGFGLLFGVAMVATVGPQMTAMQTLGRPADPAASLALMARLGPFYLLAAVVSLAFYSVAYAAVNRSLLRPGEGGPGYLAFGADEGRQFLCLVLVALVLLGVYIAGLLGALMVGTVARLALGPFGALVILLLLVAVLCLLIWLAVRLSLASALTFDTRRVRVFGSFALTRGRFWSLLGAYVLSTLLVLALYLGLMIVLSALAFVVGGGVGAIGRLFRPDMTSLAAYFAPLTVLQLLIGAVLAPVQLFAMIGAPAGAYAQLRGSNPADVF